jgi:glycosyltransferase involved in cell wall biosynthesis
VNVFLTDDPRSHPAYSELAAAPPDGVRFTWTEDAGPTDSSRIRRTGARAAARMLGLPNMVPLVSATGRVDLVHSCQRLLLTRRPWVVDVEHGQPFVGTDFDRLNNPLTRAVILRVLRSAGCRSILPWSETAARAFVATFNPDAAVAQKIRVVHPAVRPANDYVRPSMTAECRLLFVANRPAYNAILKGARELLDAFRVLRATRPALSLTVVGPTLDGFQASAKDVAGVRLVGPVTKARLDELYRNADIFVLPTLSDTFGMVFVEAMAYGLPIVALDRPFTRDVVRPGETGLLVPMPASVVHWCADDGRFTMSSDAFIQAVSKSLPEPALVRGLIEALAALVDDAALRRRLGAAGRDEVLSGRFSVSRRNQALGEIYSRIVGG